MPSKLLSKLAATIHAKQPAPVVSANRADAAMRLSSPRMIALLVMQVRDDDAAKIARLTETAVGILGPAGATIETLQSSLIVASWGVFLSTSDNTTRLPIAVEKLHGQLGSDIKTVSGLVTVPVGNIGGPNFLSFGSVVPHFGVWLATLTALSWGERKELHISSTTLQSPHKHPSGQPGL